MIGRNGEGKSNLLEAVELLGSLRSHRCSADRDLIRHGERQALIAADTAAGDRLELELRRQGGRQARRNGKVLERQHELIGPLRCVGFSALDLELVRGEPALRRQWLDRVVLQLEPVYAELLSRCAISVDTPYYNGGITAIEALAHGTPILTLPTDSMRGRYGRAFMTAVGMGQWVAASPEDYVQKARQWKEMREAMRQADTGALFEDRGITDALNRWLLEG